jgi:hypothetical protein
VLIATLPLPDGPPLVKKNFQRSPKRHPADDQQAFRHNLVGDVLRQQLSQRQACRREQQADQQADQTEAQQPT